VRVEGGCVVLVNEDPNYLSGKIPAYTNCDVYYSVQNYYGIPQKRIEHGYLSLLRLRGISSENIMQYLNNHETEVRAASFTNWLELWRDSKDPWLSSIRDDEKLSAWENSAIELFASSYNNFLTGNFKTELKKYKLDYVVWDTKRNPEWNQGEFTFLSEVYEANGIIVFMINP